MNDLIRGLNCQKTTRRNQFSNKTINQNDIEIIKNSILQTANASNRQSYSVMVLDSDHAKRIGLPGDKVLLFCVDFHRLHRCAELLNCKFDSTYLMQFATALTDISMLAQSSILAAQSLGINTLITNEIYHNKLDTVFELLEIPSRHVFPMLAVCLGYSEHKHESTKGRVNADIIFHENRYVKLSDEQIWSTIREYDNKEKHIGLITDWDEKGYKHYLEWFFEKWCPNIGSRKQNDSLLDALSKHEMI
jgi:FMN reductase [NAD(P)H]